MKTSLPFSIAGWLALALFGCGSNDDGAGLSAPLDTTATMGAEANPPASAVSTPSHSLEDVSSMPPLDLDPVVANVDPVDAHVDGADPIFSDPIELQWRACGQFEDRELQCAELEVPVDYAQPDGDTVWLALRRILANPLETHRGSLLYNPGGPGGAGIDDAISLSKQGAFDRIAPGFDIVGFDPRGVAESGERGCGIATDSLYGSATTPEDEGGLQGVVNYYKQRGEECEKQWGPLFRKIGSNNVVRDMEEIRKALGEPVLNFYGISYGTRLGALYAHAYPQTTGHIVLDAVMPPRASYIEEMRDDFYQAVSLNEQFFQGCEAATIECPPNARQVFEEAVSYATARGVGAAFVGAWVAAFASRDDVGALPSVLAAEVAAPGGDWIESFATGDDDGGGLVPYASVTCTDDPFEPPTLEQLDSIATELAATNPILAISFTGYATLCAGWPTTRDPTPLPTAKDASPLLVIGGTSDVRTPYAWAQAMTETLGNATLLTSNHFGHSALSPENGCVLDYIRAYLTSGSMPASGATCP